MHPLRLMTRKLLHRLHHQEVPAAFASQATLLERFPWEMPLESAECVVVDCEMSGLEAARHDLLAIGAVRLRGGRVHLQESFYRVVRPAEAEPLDRDNVLIHRLSDDQVQDGVPLAEALQAFVAFIGEDFLIAHVPRLDLAFLNRGLREQAGVPLQNPVVDTARLYRWWRQREEPHLATEQESIALETLREKLGLPVFPAHHAQGDALTTACLYLKLRPALAAAGHRTVKDLHRIAGA